MFTKLLIDTNEEPGFDSINLLIDPVASLVLLQGVPLEFRFCLLFVINTNKVYEVNTCEYE